MSHVHAFLMHTYSQFNIFWYIWTAWDFSDCLSLSPTFFYLCSLCLWNQNVSLLRPRTLFVPVLLHLLILLLLTFSSMMMMPIRHFWRTSLDEAFIWNAKSFWRTLPDTNLPSIIHSRGWESLCDVLVTCPLVYPGVLLHHARDWSFSTSLFHSHSRYAHSCHTAAGCGCASSP